MMILDAYPCAQPCTVSLPFCSSSRSLIRHGFHLTPLSKSSGPHLCASLSCLQHNHYSFCHNSPATWRGLKASMPATTSYRKSCLYRKDGFDNKNSTNALRLNQDIPTVSGATLSARAITDGSRLALSLINIVKP